MLSDLGWYVNFCLIDHKAEKDAWSHKCLLSTSQEICVYQQYQYQHFLLPNIGIDNSPKNEKIKLTTMFNCNWKSFLFNNRSYEQVYQPPCPQFLSDFQQNNGNTHENQWKYTFFYKKGNSISCTVRYCITEIQPEQTISSAAQMSGEHQLLPSGSLRQLWQESYVHCWTHTHWQKPTHPERRL